MNILILNHYAGSPEMGMEFRPYYLAKEWIRLGHKVTIVAADFSHLRIKQPIVASDFQSEKKNGIIYYWIKTSKYNSSGFKRVLNILMFTFKVMINFKKISITTNPEVVIASSTYLLDIYPAFLIAKNNKARLVFEVHDLWPLSPQMIGGYSRYHPYIVLLQLAENYAYKHCDKVVSILPYAKEHMVKHGLKKEKFCYIPNGIVIEDWVNPKELPNKHQLFIDRLKEEGKFFIAYSGAHGSANSLITIIDSVDILDSKNIVLVLLGSGPEKGKLMYHVEMKNIKNVYFLDPIEKYAIPTFLKQMDILFLGLVDAPLFQYGISPNKLFDYMMAAKPIILAVNSENNIVNEAKCGYSINSYSLDVITEAIIKLHSMSRENRDILGNNGHEFVCKYHNYSILAKKFIDSVTCTPI